MSDRAELFLPPQINASKLAARPKLMARITDLARRGVLFIHAPAGYGKTTAAAQWIGGRKAGWFSLDEYSSVPANFYRGILTALSAPAPEDFDDAPREAMIAVLQKLREWPAVLVIDDFHLISDSAAAAALPIIRSRMPESASFLVLSRNPPPDGLREHIIKGAVRRIDDLRFSGEEISALFGKNGTVLSKSEVERLCAETDGWAAALTAIIMSNAEDGYTGIVKRETLNQYLRTYLFEYWERFDDLKKCSVCDVLNSGLCEAVTGAADIWEVITALANKTGLVSRYGNNTYKFHALLKEALESELDADEKIDKPSLYKTAAHWYMENGDWLHTLDMAAKSGDHDAVEEIARTASEIRDGFGVDAAQYIRFVEKTFLSIPSHIIAQYPRLSMHCSLVSLLSRPISDACMWEDILEKQMEEGLTKGSDCIAAALQTALDPRYSSWRVAERFKRLRLSGPIPAAGRTTVVPISLNFPFFHKGPRDFTDSSRELSEYLSEVRRHVEPILGPLVKVMAALIESGMRYERGEVSKAESIAEALAGSVDNLSPELRFCAMVLYEEILRVQGKDAELEAIGDMIEETGAHYLSANYSAFMTNIGLDNGDESAAVKWLEGQSPIRSMQLYKVYQHFTTAKAMMAAGKLSAAEKLLDRLVNFSSDYRRSADHIEALALRAVCLWRLKRTKESVTVFTAAILKAREFELIMPIIKNGGAVLPVLQKILNRLKYGYDADILDKAFVNSLRMRSREISKHTPGIFSRAKSRPIKLSPRQSEVLGYLVQSLSYQEIGGKMGVTVAAVDYHVRVLHEKFDALNTRELLVKAGELGFAATE